MIGRLAVRSLLAHPVRSAVLAAGVGVGVGVMAILLGVAEVVLEQSRAPALVGGGDVLIRLGPYVPGQLVLAGPLQSDAIRPRIRVASPSHSSTVYLLHGDRSVTGAIVLVGGYDASWLDYELLGADTVVAHVFNCGISLIY